MCLLSLGLEADEDDEGVLDPAAFRLVTILDAGGDRATYLAHPVDERKGYVTVDVLRGAALAPGSDAPFEARSRELKALHHAAIARILGGWVTASLDLCLVTEYVAGRTLANRDATRGLSGAAGLRLFDLLCDALEYAHSCGVAHGRLAASSVVLVGEADRIVPRLTRFEPRPPTDAAARDVAALAGLLSVAVPAAEASPRVEAIVRRAAGAGGESRVSTVAEIRAAAASLAR